MNIDKIIDVLSNVEKVKVTVAGDYCLDKYLYVEADRDEPSVETGLTAYQVVKKAIYAGGCGTITNNLRSLGVQVNCVGILGEDGEGYELLKALEKIGADTAYMIKTDKMCTNTYTKPMRMGNGTFREMNRLDFRNFFPTPYDIEERFMENLKRTVKISDAVIISDQFKELNCSAITERIRNFIAQLALEYPKVIFYADSRGFIDRYRNVIVKCNNFEAVKCIMPDYQGQITDSVLKECGEKLYMRNNKTVYITMGERGSIAFDKDITHIPAFKVEGEIDICGAGDANNAGIVLGLALGLEQKEAALLGNAVSSITIQQMGVTGTATVEQVIKLISG
jgi:rfaE bifunctional protein kinase chain/domain